MIPTGRSGTSERDASTEPDPAAEQRRIATAYLVWPLAVAELIRESPAASAWARLHTRQAVVYGVACTLVIIALLGVPAVLVIADPPIDGATVIAWYGTALVAVLIAVLAAATGAVIFARRAAQGALFTIPIVSPIADRLLAVQPSEATRGSAD